MTEHRIGIFGGTFDPPHIGHLHLVEYAIKDLNLDEVLVIVTGHSPDNKDTMLSPDERFKITQELFEDTENVKMDKRELDSGSLPAYTIDSVKQISNENPESQLYLLLGADQAVALKDWNRWEDIIRLATIAVAKRDSVDDDTLHSATGHLILNGARVRLLSMPLHHISSHEIVSELKQ